MGRNRCGQVLRDFVPTPVFAILEEDEEQARREEEEERRLEKELKEPPNMSPRAADAVGTVVELPESAAEPGVVAGPCAQQQESRPRGRSSRLWREDPWVSPMLQDVWGPVIAVALSQQIITHCPRADLLAAMDDPRRMQRLAEQAARELVGREVASLSSMPEQVYHALVAKASTDKLLLWLDDGITELSEAVARTEERLRYRAKLVETYWSTPVNWVRGQVKAVAIAIMGKGLELAWRGGVFMAKALIKPPWS